MLKLTLVLATGLVLAIVPTNPGQAAMTFFITSAGPGNGANLGGA